MKPTLVIVVALVLGIVIGVLLHPVTVGAQSSVVFRVTEVSLGTSGAVFAATQVAGFSCVVSVDGTHCFAVIR
jgi:hypothetical protein